MFARIDTYSTRFNKDEIMFTVPAGFKPSHSSGCDGGNVLISQADGTVYGYRFNIASGTFSPRSNVPYGVLGTLCWITSED